MNRIFSFLYIAIFSVFLGSQITEGCLLLPYWKSLSAVEFYAYYRKFGLLIGRFYTILTVIAVLIPIGMSVYCFKKKSSVLKYALLATFFSLLCIALFYGYFKGINQQFLEATFSEYQLIGELKIWGYWHWTRVFFEILALLFLILTFNGLTDKNESRTK